MVKGSSSQTSTNVPRGGRSGAAPSTSAPGGGGLRRRTGTGARSGTGGGGMGRMSQSVMNFYTDDSPGIKIPPFVVVVFSLGFIGFVTLLHVIGKIRGV